MTANPLEMEEFDLDRYLRASKRVDLSGVAWDRVRSHPLTEAEARCLAYMMDIETHTSIYLRDLLATPAAYEPDVTAFLSCWVYEELWHGEAFSRFLGEAGWELAPDLERVAADTAYPSRLPRNQWIRRRLGGKGQLSHVGTMLGSAVMDDFVALHMTWGAANELSTLTSYHRLIANTEHPELVNLLNAIIKDERRHFAFYRAQARLRLARSALGAPADAMGDGAPVGDRGHRRPPADRDRLRRPAAVRRRGRPRRRARDGPHDGGAPRHGRMRDLPARARRGAGEVGRGPRTRARDVERRPRLTRGMPRGRSGAAGR